MQMAQGIDDNGFSVAHDHIAEAATRWTADLKNAKTRAIDNCPCVVMIAPCLHAPLKGASFISKADESLCYEFRSTPFSANSQNWRAFRKLFGKVALHAGDYGINHVVLTARF